MRIKWTVARSTFSLVHLKGMNVKQYLVMAAIALAVVWVSNNVEMVGDIVGPRA